MQAYTEELNDNPYYKEDIDLSRIYRYMDKLYNSQMELLQEISIHHTRRILGGNIGLLFYDVTTLLMSVTPWELPCLWRDIS